MFSASKFISHPAQNPAGTSSNEDALVIGEAPPVIGGLYGTIVRCITSMPDEVCISTGQPVACTGAAPPVIISSRFTLDGLSTGILAAAPVVIPSPQPHPHVGKSDTITPGVGHNAHPQFALSPIITLLASEPTIWLSE